MSFHGALVRKASQQNTANYSTATAVAWDQEVYDFDGWHDNSTNNTRLTVPAALNGQYGRFTVCVSIQNQASPSVVGWVYIARNGSLAYTGVPMNYRNTRDNFAGYTGQGAWLHCSSGPFLLTTNDYYEAFFFTQDANVDLRTESGFSVYVINVGSRSDIRCAAQKSTTLTGQNFSTLTAQTWDTEIYDTDSIHDNSSNTSRLTIPSTLDGKFAIIHGQIRTQSNAGAQSQGLGIRKNGSSYTYDGFGGASWDVGNLGSETYIQCCTHPIQVTASDYYELMYANGDTTTDIEATTSAFGLYCVGG